MSADLLGSELDGSRASVGGNDTGTKGLTKIIEYIATSALDSEGGLAAHSASLLGLRNEPDRDLLLRELVRAIRPSSVNPEVWLKWIYKGVSPFASDGLAKVGTDNQSRKKSIDRSSVRVNAAEAEVAKAEARLKAAQEALDRTKAFDSALIEFVVSEHLVSIMNPSFSMGPAWTIMRSISAHLDAEAMATKTSIAGSEKHRLEIENSIIAERREETERLMRSLDLWCGDAVFEEELRIALLEIVARYEPHEAERNNGPNRGRGREARRVQVNPNSIAQAEAVLDGLKLEPF